MVCRLPLVSTRTSGLRRSSGRRRRSRSIGQWRRYAQSTSLTVHLQLKDFSDLSSVTVKKFHAPSLHLVAAWNRLDKPARGSRVIVADPRRIGAHEKAHAAPALGGELQPPRLDLA